MTGLTFKDRVGLTISSIEHSDEFEDNWDLFTKGVEVLRGLECESDLSDEDRDLLEEIFIIISS